MTRRLAGKVAMITGAASGIAASVTTGNPDDIAATTERIASISPLGSAGVPDDIAAAALSLAGDDARYVSGHTLVVDAGQTTAGMTPNRFNIGSSREFHEAGRLS